MIFIQTSGNDRSTANVMDWIYFLDDVTIQRVNDHVTLQSIEIDDEVLLFSNDTAIYAQTMMTVDRTSKGLFSHAKEEKPLSAYNSHK